MSKRLTQEELRQQRLAAWLTGKQTTPDTSLEQELSLLQTKMNGVRNQLEELEILYGELQKEYESLRRQLVRTSLTISNPEES